MYSIGNVFRQEPSAITAVAVAILNVVVLSGLWHPTQDLIVAINATVPLLLSLFYIRPLVASKDALTKLANGNGNPPANIPPVIEPPTEVAP